MSDKETLPPIPAKPGGHNLHAIKRYYEDNKKLILKYIDVLGLSAMLRQWGMSKDTTWHRLKKRWGLKDVGDKCTAISQEEVPELEPEPEPEQGVGKGGEVDDSNLTSEESAEEVRKIISQEEEPEAEPAPEPDVPDVEVKVFPYICPNCPAMFADGGDLWEHIKLHFKAILPDFPAFNPKWKKETQIEWLKAYVKMAEMVKKGQD